MGMGYNKSKFVFSETFNNSTGKTSGSGFVGVLLGITATLGILAGIVGFFLQVPLLVEFLEKMIQVAGIAGLLLGVRKAAGAFAKPGNNPDAVLPPGTDVTPEKG